MKYAPALLSQALAQRAATMDNVRQVFQGGPQGGPGNRPPEDRPAGVIARCMIASGKALAVAGAVGAVVGLVAIPAGAVAGFFGGGYLAFSLAGAHAWPLVGKLAAGMIGAVVGGKLGPIPGKAAAILSAGAAVGGVALIGFGHRRRQLEAQKPGPRLPKPPAPGA